MNPTRIYFVSAILSLVGILGCDQKPENKPANAPSQTSAPSGSSQNSAVAGSSVIPPGVPLIAGSATIIGRVTFAGSPPPTRMIDVSSVADCAAAHPNGLPDESVVVAPSGGLANTIVYLKDFPASGSGASLSPAIIDQVGCQYRPHVVAVQIGQILRVQSHDPFVHNINVRSVENDPSNFVETAAANAPASHDLTFLQPEFFPLHCDVHPWMNAWVGVFSHPYFAVTDADGNFKIEHLPAGTYTLAAWHERLGELSQPIVLHDHASQHLNFTYAP